MKQIRNFYIEKMIETHQYSLFKKGNVPMMGIFEQDIINYIETIKPEDEKISNFLHYSISFGMNRLFELLITKINQDKYYEYIKACAFYEQEDMYLKIKNLFNYNGKDIKEYNFNMAIAFLLDKNYFKYVINTKQMIAFLKNNDPNILAILSSEKNAAHKILSENQKENLKSLVLILIANKDHVNLDEIMDKRFQLDLLKYLDSLECSLLALKQV